MECTPVGTILRAVTGIVTLYMEDVGVVWVWLTVFLYSTKKPHSQRTFAMVMGSPAVQHHGHVVTGSLLDGTAHIGVSTP